MKEKTKIKLFAIAAALILGMFGCMFGQTVTAHRFNNRPDIVSIMPESPIEFGYIAGSKDNMIITIVKDIISKDSISYKIFACLPKGKDPKNYELVLRFKDGIFYRYNVAKVYKEGNWAEYEILPDGLSQLKCGEVDVVMIRYNGDVYLGGFDNGSKYFQDFLQLCKN